MAQPKSTTIASERRVATLRAQLFGPKARQKLFAFASLILLMVFFSFASPAFIQVAIPDSERQEET